QRRRVAQQPVGADRHPHFRARDSRAARREIHEDYFSGSRSPVGPRRLTMGMKKIKRNDEVIVIAGKDKGKRGKVLRVLDDGRLLVSGIQVIKKHQKPNPQLGVPGGIIEKEAAIDSSNVALYNPETRKADRAGFKVLEDGTKVRVFKSNGAVVGG